MWVLFMFFWVQNPEGTISLHGPPIEIGRYKESSNCEEESKKLVGVTIAPADSGAQFAWRTSGCVQVVPESKGIIILNN